MRRTAYRQRYDRRGVDRPVYVGEAGREHGSEALHKRVTAARRRHRDILQATRTKILGHLLAVQHGYADEDAHRCYDAESANPHRGAVHCATMMRQALAAAEQETDPC